MSVQAALRTAQGPVRLGAELGRGGEGAVYALPGDRVAKVYHAPPDAELRDKLAAMVRVARPELTTFCAWPEELLLDGAAVRGVTMPRVPPSFQPIHLLYSPRSRLDAFPQASWRFLCHVGANLARAFAAIHTNGHVVGDVNHANVLVGPKGVVRLIDCDSFQVRAERVFRCRVGVSTHTPPELQGVNLADVERAERHDAFGLAVLLYQLLMMGRHPFAGRHAVDGEMTLERAIREHRYVYAADAAARGTRPPPLCAPVDVLGPTGPLFSAAFAPARTRPAPKDWIPALDALAATLVTCPANRAHHHPPAMTTCPWCALEGAAGVVFFQWLPTADGVGAFDPEQAIKRIEQLFVGGVPALAELEAAWSATLAQGRPTPPVLPAVPEAPVQPSAALVAAAAEIRGARRLGRRVVAAGAVVLGLGTVWSFSVPQALALVLVLVPVLWFASQIVEGLFVIHVSRAASATARAALAAELEANRTLAELAKQHASPERLIAFDRLARELAATYAEASRDAHEYGDALDELRATNFATARAERDRWKAVPAQRAARLHALRVEAERRQLERFLDRHPLTEISVLGIGPTRLATLAAFGVTTAADIDVATLDGVPGIGPAMRDRLLDWRASLVRGHVPAHPVDVAALEARVDEVLRAEQEVHQGRLEKLVESTRRRRDELRRKLTTDVGVAIAELRAGVVTGRRLAAEVQAGWTATRPELERAAAAVAQARADVKFAREVLG